MFSDLGCSTPCMFGCFTPVLLCSSGQDLSENGAGHLRKLYRLCCSPIEVYMNLYQLCEILNIVNRTLSLDSQKIEDLCPQSAQKMTFSQNISSDRLSAILLNVRTLNVSSSFCSLWASGLFSPDLLPLFLLFTQLCNTLKEFPSQNHRQKKS